MSYSDLVFKHQKYMGDFAWFFTINARYSGYTRDKIVFHVLDHQSPDLAYRSFNNRADFEAFLQNPGPETITETANEKNSSSDFLSNIIATDTGKISTGLLLLGALILGILIINKN